MIAEGEAMYLWKLQICVLPENIIILNRGKFVSTMDPKQNGQRIKRVSGFRGILADLGGGGRKSQ